MSLKFTFITYTNDISSCLLGTALSSVYKDNQYIFSDIYQ